MAAGAGTEQNFSVSGPTHLVGTTIDWENAHHRRIIMASLVQGVYTLKSKKEKERCGRDLVLAPQWWELFHFQKTEELHDPKDDTVFGAIFKLPSANHHHNYTPNYYNNVCHSTITPPKYVIAFRGTSLEEDSAFQDLKLDLKCILNLVHESSRVGVAMRAVERTIDENNGADPNAIWLAGHSLGAAIAQSVGKDIVLNRGIHLEAYLFNPPCAHFPVATIRNDSAVVKRVIRFSRSLATAAVATIQGCHEDDTEFARLLKWKPYMFLNKKDRICNEYIEYFKHRERMARVIGLGKIERVATQYSITSLIPGARPSHLLPVAYLISNLSPEVDNFRQAHALKQWWVPQTHFYYESKLYDKFWQILEIAAARLTRNS